LARGKSESDKKFALLTQVRIKVTMPGYPQKSLKTLIGKLRDVVGLYLNPPDKALVLCVDQKSRVQGLE
jgi:hypothetical protein